MEELEKVLREKLGEKLDELIKKKIDEFNGLLNKNAAMMIISKELGINFEKKIKLSQLPKEPIFFSFSAKVKRIFPIQYYPNSKDYSARIHLIDDNAEATLVLWNEQINFLNEILTESIIECKGAYVKNRETYLSKNGSVRRIGGRELLKVSDLSLGICSVEGFVKEIEPDYFYIDKKDGKEKKMSSFIFCDEKICRRAVIWDEQIERPSKGDFLILDNAVFKNSEIHLNYYSRIIKKISVNEKIGILEDAKIDGEEISLKIGNENFRINDQNALEIFNIKQVDGIEKNTILKIKLNQLIGKKIKYYLKDSKIIKIEEEN
jgi:hypothetical protein